MGLLIFAFRKLFLKRRINQLNGRQMQLSQTKQTVTDQIGRVQRNKAAAQSAFSMMMQNTAAQNTSIFQSTMSGYTQGLYELKDQYAAAQKEDPNSEVALAAKAAMDEAKEKAQLESQELYAEFMGAQQQLTMQSNMMSQSMEASDTGELQQLQAKDSQLELETASNESMLKELNGELDGVEKAETDAAKKEAPNFGLA